MSRWLAFACGALLACPLPAQVSLETLRRGHPRLIALDADIERVRQLIRTNETARELHRRLTAAAEKIEAAPAVEYKLIGPRLLDKSRTTLDRIYTLALLYRLDPQPKYLARALKEMKAAAGFPDWNPSHFLDVAEMTHAFAVGYDWLYPSLTPADRQWIRKAIVEKGLDPALEIYENRRWWTVATHNWNQVCNGGITLGALAVAEDEPSRSESVLRYSVESVPRAMASYGPDGGWAEGPAYWHYATRYTVYLLAGLESALGTDFGLSKTPGFERAGHFRVYFEGPSARTFNYADGGDAVEPAEELFWLARRFDQPVYAWQQLEVLKHSQRAHALDLVWFPDKSRTPAEADWPLNVVFQGVNAAFLRESWNKDALWLGVKGGDNAANHSHLDLGSFVLDALGQRWALDLGSDDYNLPEYFGKLRWTYYRLRTESHNTVLFRNANQDLKAQAPLRFTGSRAVIDLSGAYPGRVSRYTRRVELSGGKVTIDDNLEAADAGEALWGMVTDAEVSLEGRKAVLRKPAGRLVAEILSPEGARFDTVSTQPAAPQKQNQGTRKLVVRLPAPVRAVHITVVLRPERSTS